MINDRKLYDKLKSLNISTLEVNRILKEVNIEIPQRTLQSYFDNNFSTCKDERVEKIVKKIIANKHQFIEKLKKQFG